MRIKKMNSATGTHLLAKYGLKGVAFCSDGNPTRYICGCGNVSGGPHCDLCGNEEYKNINGSWSAYSGFHYLAVAPDTYTHKDDASIAPNVIAEKSLSVKADVKANQFVLEETYSPFIEINDKGILFGASYTGLAPEDVLEAHKNDVMTPKQLAFYEEAKVRYETWGINKNTDCKQYMIISYYMRMLLLVDSGDITIPEKDIYEYRALMLRACRSITGSVSFNSIEDVIQKLNFPVCFKEYYKFDISGAKMLSAGSCYGFNNNMLKSISMLVQNSFLFALMHGQLDLSGLIAMLINLKDTPEAFQEEFVEFFGKHVAIFKDETLTKFAVFKDAAKAFPEQPAKFDAKSVSILETLRWMKARGINEIRAEMVMEALEKDPMVAIQLLHEKKKVTKEERQLFDAMK